MALRDRSKMKKQLQKRTKDSYKRKDFGGGGRKALQVEDTKMWTVKEDDHFIDIIPFEVGSKYPTPPSVAKNDLPEEGDYHYVLDYWVHNGMGPSKRDTYLCLEANYGLPCPVCEKMNELIEEGYDWQDDVIKALKPKRRVAYNIWCHDSKKEEKEGVQILEIAHFFMEKHLAELSRDPKKGGHIAFSDPDEGKQIFFNKKGSLRNQEFSGFRFYDRDEPIPDEILEQTVCLDECLIVPTYDELYEVLSLTGSSSSEEEKEEKSESTKYEPKEEQEEEEITADYIKALTLKELKELVKNQKLNIKVAKYKQSDLLAEKIIEEMGLVEKEEEPEEEEELTADDIREMSLDDLKKLVSEQDLGIKVKKYKKSEDLAEKIIEELELESEEEEEPEEGQDSEEEEEDITADDIREMGLDDLKELVEENELNISTKKYKKKADAKKLAEKIIEELDLEEEEGSFDEPEDAAFEEEDPEEEEEKPKKPRGRKKK